MYGNISELRDVSMDPWKSYLFFLTHRGLEIRLSGDKAICEVKHFTI